MTKLIEKSFPVLAWLGPATSVTPQQFPMKNYDKAVVLVETFAGGSSGASAISLKQKVGQTGANTVFAFSEAYRALNVGTQGAPNYSWEKFTVSSDTFNTDATSGSRNIYAIEVKAEDFTAGYDTLVVNAGNGANTTMAITVVGYDPKYPSFPQDPGDLA